MQVLRPSLSMTLEQAAAERAVAPPNTPAPDTTSYIRRSTVDGGRPGSSFGQPPQPKRGLIAPAPTVAAATDSGATLQLALQRSCSELKPFSSFGSLASKLSDTAPVAPPPSLVPQRSSNNLRSAIGTFIEAASSTSSTALQPPTQRTSSNYKPFSSFGPSHSTAASAVAAAAAAVAAVSAAAVAAPQLSNHSLLKDPGSTCVNARLSGKYLGPLPRHESARNSIDGQFPEEEQCPMPSPPVENPPISFRTTVSVRRSSYMTSNERDHMTTLAGLPYEGMSFGSYVQSRMAALEAAAAAPDRPRPPLLRAASSSNIRGLSSTFSSLALNSSRLPQRQQLQQQHQGGDPALQSSSGTFAGASMPTIWQGACV